MKIGGLGVPELVIILIVALLIFGPKNLPKLGSALGKTVKNLREGMGSSNLDGADEGEETADEEAAELVEEEVYEEEPAEEEPASKKAAPKKAVKKAVKKSE